MFKVGEVVIMQNAQLHFELNGTETSVVAVGKNIWDGRGLHIGIGFEIDVRNPFDPERNLVAFAHQLRRKKPPTEYKGEQEILSLFKVKPREVCDAG